MRRTRELGCNKVAYAHHSDDIVETMMLSLMYEGRFYSFPPVTYLDGTELTVIRPLMFVWEADIIGFKNKICASRREESLSCRRSYEAPGDQRASAGTEPPESRSKRTDVYSRAERQDPGLANASGQTFFIVSS